MRIAALDARERGLGERGLDAQDRCRVGLGLLGRFAAERQQLLDVGDVLLAQLHALCVGLEVVVAVGQAETAGAHLDDDHRGVNRILIGAGVEEEAAGIGRGAVELMAAISSGRVFSASMRASSGCAGLSPRASMAAVFMQAAK